MMNKKQKITSNSTDRKVMIKRRADGVYDIYLDDKHVESKGSIQSATGFVASLFAEE